MSKTYFYTYINKNNYLCLNTIFKESRRRIWISYVWELLLIVIYELVPHILMQIIDSISFVTLASHQSPRYEEEAHSKCFYLKVMHAWLCLYCFPTTDLNIVFAGIKDWGFTANSANKDVYENTNQHLAQHQCPDTFSKD